MAAQQSLLALDIRYTFFLGRILKKVYRMRVRGFCSKTWKTLIFVPVYFCSSMLFWRFFLPPGGRLQRAQRDRQACGPDAGTQHSPAGRRAWPSNRSGLASHSLPRTVLPVTAGLLGPLFAHSPPVPYGTNLTYGPQQGHV